MVVLDDINNFGYIYNIKFNRPIRLSIDNAS